MRSVNEPWPQRLKQLAALALILAPIGAFYLILWRDAVRIPILDDYEIVLDLASWLSQHHSPSARLLLMLTREHNGYKLMFDNAVIFGQYLLEGQVHFLPLVMLGNLLALCIFLVVVRMARFSPSNTTDRWTLLAPVAWLVMQLQYASALDFSSCSLQNLGVVLFALLSIYWLDREPYPWFAASCAALVLAIASSPSGFFAAPVGFLMLFQSRRWKRMALWTLAATLMFLLYLFRYIPPSAGARVAGGSPSGLAHLNLLYAISFMGSSAARFSSIAPAVLLGVLLCSVFLFSIKLKYFRTNPPVFYSMLFILITALAVSGLRSDLGLAQSLASRYRIYSNLFLAFTYIFAVETLLPLVGRRDLRRAAVGLALAIAIAFGSLSDMAGARFLHGKKEALVINYRTQWQGRAAEQDSDAIQALANPVLRRQIKDGVYDINTQSIREAVRNGVYSPPQNP